MFAQPVTGKVRTRAFKSHVFLSHEDLLIVGDNIQASPRTHFFFFFFQLGHNAARHPAGQKTVRSVGSFLWVCFFSHSPLGCTRLSMLWKICVNFSKAESSRDKTRERREESQNVQAFHGNPI